MGTQEGSALRHRLDALAIIVTILCLSSHYAAAAVHLVMPGDDLAAALRTASFNDTVALTPGTYLGPLVPTVPLTIAGIGILSRDNADIDRVIIALPDSLADSLNASCVVYRQVPQRSRLEYLTLRGSGGSWNDVTACRGGGAILVDRDTVDCSNCDFIECSSSGPGGAILAASPQYSYLTQLSLQSCRFVGCSSPSWGGALYAAWSSLVMVDCDFDSCSAFSSDGGAAFIDGCIVEIDGISVTNCSGSVGGFRIGGSNGSLQRSVFYGNVGTSDFAVDLQLDWTSLSVRWCEFRGAIGRSVFVQTSRGDRLWSCRFVGSQTPGGALFVSTGGTTVNVTNCRFDSLGGSSGAAYANDRGRISLQRCSFTGNRFSDGTLYATETSHISASGCSFIGNSGYADHGTPDLSRCYWGADNGPYNADRNEGGRGDTVDVATYEPYLISPPDSMGLDVDERPNPRAALPVRRWQLLEPFPNPCNGWPLIRLDGYAAEAEAYLVNVLGQRVATLFRGPLLGTVVLSSGAPLPFGSGTYFVVAKGPPEAQQIKRVILIR